MRVLLASTRTGELDSLRRFGALLESHIRFEERELFPACEARLEPEVLNAVAARAPKKTSQGCSPNQWGESRQVASGIASGKLASAVFE